MSRTSLAAFCLAFVSCVVAVLLFVFGSRRLEELARQVSDDSRRMTAIESVYESFECPLVVVGGTPCDLGEGRSLFLGEPDPDGEVRWLTLRTKEGTTRLGRLNRGASYVRLKEASGVVSGFMEDAKEGLVEVYSSEPALNTLEGDERFPTMVKHVFQMTTSTMPEKKKPRER